MEGFERGRSIAELGNREKAGEMPEVVLLLKSLMEEKALEKWQQYFCDVANVFVCCVDEKGTPLTRLGGKEEELCRIRSIIDGEKFQDMLMRVSESALEDQAIETTAYPNIRLAAVSAKLQGKAVVNWLVCGVISDAGDLEEYENPPLEGFTSQISEKQFAKVVDALRDVTNDMIQYRFASISAQAESRRSKFSEKEMSENLRLSESLAEVVQFLGGAEPAENMLYKLLKTVGERLGLDAAALYRIGKDECRVQILSKWCGKTHTWEPEEAGDGLCSQFLKTDKTLILSQSSMLNSDEKEEMGRLGLKAVIVIPVESSQGDVICACFGQIDKDREWKLEEIRFLNDSVKILHSIFTGCVQKDALTDALTCLETVLDHVGDCICVWDLETGKVLYTNRNMQRNFRQELQEGNIEELLGEWMHEESGSREIYLAGKERWYDLYYTGMKWLDGSAVVLCSLYDVTDKKDYQKKIEQQAYTDFLTGIYNRMCCERDLAKYVDEAKENQTKGLLLYLDLDDFKHINDGLGHKYGDVLLKSISQSFQQIKGIKDTCYRMGGDEFVIIIPPSEYEEHENIIEAIKQIFKQPWSLKDSDYYCTMSMGVVEFPLESDVVPELIKKADIAMYEAKKRGKNRTEFYSNSIDSKSGKRLDMEKNMRDATAEGYHEFEIYYQPIIDVGLEGAPCTGAEALIRWNSAKMGFIPPSEFIPLAEYLGLINPIGNYVLREACTCCKNWNDHGYPNYKVNVNLSVVQLLQPDIVESVEKIVKETGITPHNLTLEVTESLAINDMERMKEILNRIKELGIRIALDDFGTGYSSLNHIRELPFDVIKVDQSFIVDLERDTYAKSFIRMVEDLADAIGVNVCVEGVETKKQYEILSEMGVSLVQGYYFDRPMERSSFEKKYTPKLKRKRSGRD